MDLTGAAQVKVSYDEAEANGMLTDGWTLAAAGIGSDGYPVFVLVDVPAADPVPAEPPATIPAAAPPSV